MGIRPLTSREFESFGPSRSPGTELMLEEYAWFADDAANVIGVVVRDRADGDWGWIALGRDEEGAFRAVNVGVDIETEAEAHASLRTELLQLAASGDTVFPQRR